MPPVITLTTDFGEQGPFVGILKAVIWQRLPEARIVDLGHGMARDYPPEAGFWLAQSWRHFPAGSVHVAVVDPGVGSARRLLAAVLEDHVFLAPDNGLLPLVLGEVPGEVFAGAPVWALDESRPAAWGWPAPSATFHGSDLFAPLAAEFAAGRLHPRDIGPPAGRLVEVVGPATTAPDGSVGGDVVAVDTWGNLVSNIPAGALSAFRRPEVAIGAIRVPVGPTYAAAAPGEALCLINAWGFVEIAVRDGSAARVLGLRHGAVVTVREGG
jgi:S-adenosylmethionine hydrolase